jgi:hypothetical protein
MVRMPTSSGTKENTTMSRINPATQIKREELKQLLKELLQEPDVKDVLREIIREEPAGNTL